MTVLQPKKQQQDTKGRVRMVKFNDVPIFTKQEGAMVPIKSTASQTRKKVTKESLYVNVEVGNAVMRKAEEIESALPRNYPTLIKLMQPSHVTGGFWLGLPRGFCANHLPDEDTMIDLEDENGKVLPTKYLAHKHGLSGGWRGFSIDHKLLQGDVLVFHLVKPTKFKVYIVRVSGTEEDVAPGFPKMDRTKEQVESAGDTSPDSIGESGWNDFEMDLDMLVGILEEPASLPLPQQEQGIIPNKSTTSKTRKRAAIDSLYVNDEVENSVLRKAREVESSLPKNFPTMIKVMLSSHVSSGFSLSLAKGFGTKHLPDEDTTMELEDEDGKIHFAKYLVHKQGLSGGWRAFSIDHNLAQGDVLVFQLVKPTRLKVYIVRASGSDEVEVALGLLQMDNDREQLKSEYIRKGCKESNKGLSNNNSEVDEADNGEEDDGFGFAISDGIRMCESAAIDFHQVKSFDDFDIVVNGLVINCELSKHLQRKYYELCSSQKLFLHEHIINGLNCKLIVGIISETINIADAIRASEFGGTNNTQQKEDFVLWEDTLVAFDKLGMNVEFILTRLRQLMGLCDNVNRHKRLRTERVRAEEEVEMLKAKLNESVGRIASIDEEMGRLEVDEVDVEVRFRELAKAPWSHCD